MTDHRQSSLADRLAEAEANLGRVVAWLHHNNFPFDWSTATPAPSCIKALLAERYANEDDAEIADVLWSFDQEQDWDCGHAQNGVEFGATEIGAATRQRPAPRHQEMES